MRVMWVILPREPTRRSKNGRRLLQRDAMNFARVLVVVALFLVASLGLVQAGDNAATPESLIVGRWKGDLSNKERIALFFEANKTVIVWSLEGEVRKPTLGTYQILGGTHLE